MKKYKVKIEGYPEQNSFGLNEKEARQVVFDKFKANGIELPKLVWIRTKEVKPEKE